MFKQTSTPPPRSAAVKQHVVVSHTVSRGETLSEIARKYLGEGGRWSDVAAANPGINPNVLKPGQQIRIPDSVMLASNSSKAEPRFRMSSPPAASAKASKKTAKHTARAAKPAKTAKASKAKPKATRTEIITEPNTPALADDDFALTGTPSAIGDKPLPVSAAAIAKSQSSNGLPPAKQVEIAKAAPPPAEEIQTAKAAPLPDDEAPSGIAVAVAEPIAPKVQPAPQTVIRQTQKVQVVSPAINKPARVKSQSSGSAPLRLARESGEIRNEKPKIPEPSTNVVVRRPSSNKQASQVARSSFYSCMADKCSYHKNQ